MFLRLYNSNASKLLNDLEFQLQKKKRCLKNEFYL